MLAVTLAALLAAAPLQEPRPGPPPGPPPQGEALRLFLDCEQWICDLDFMRTEITFVNYMRDRADAQLHVLVTTETTGGGGTAYTLTFLGLREFQGRADTLHFTTPATSTDDEKRRGIARTLRLGLMRYVASTPLADRIEIRYRAPEAAGVPAAQPHDPWNYWVFSLNASGYFNGEQSYRYRSVNASVNASRTTEQWKMSYSLSANSNRNSYAIDDTTTFVSNRESYYGNALVVRSRGQHWSYGGRVSVSQESYRNIKLRWSVSPTVEYSVFPYSESTRRLLLIRYHAGPQGNTYNDTTIYFRTAETRMTHGIDAFYSVTQPWGSASVSSSFQQYLHDTRKLNLETYANASIRLVRGLSLELYGGYSVIHDQLYLPAAGATPEEIIAQQRQLATGYSYWGNVGISYRFGSVFNNIVNPRFRG